MRLALVLLAACTPRALFTVNFDAKPASYALLDESGEPADVRPYLPGTDGTKIVYSLVIGAKYVLRYRCGATQDTTDREEQLEAVAEGRNEVSLSCAATTLFRLSVEAPLAIQVTDAKATGDSADLAGRRLVAGETELRYAEPCIYAVLDEGQRAVSYCLYDQRLLGVDGAELSETELLEGLKGSVEED